MHIHQVNFLFPRIVYLKRLKLKSPCSNGLSELHDLILSLDGILLGYGGSDLPLLCNSKRCGKRRGLFWGLTSFPFLDIGYSVFKAAKVLLLLLSII